MFCRYCQTLILDNKGPCPSCGAPSPLMGPTPINGWETTTPTNQRGPGAQNNNWETPAQNNGWDNPAASQWGQSTPQAAFGTPAQPFMPTEQQVTFPDRRQTPMDQQQSMLPVLYQGGKDMQPRSMTIPLQFLPDHALEKLLPALPSQEETVYVQPMYTKPRAIIPRYRIISGFLSFLIVMLALCGGVGYYAQVSGKIDAAKRFITGNPPQSLQPTPLPQIPDPPTQTANDLGPGEKIITSATIATRIDPTKNIAFVSETIFKPMQHFFLIYSVSSPKNKGFVIVKWYMNDILFKTQSSYDETHEYINAGENKNGKDEQVYPQPATGKVEIYWSDAGGTPLRAQTLYFSVRN